MMGSFYTVCFVAKADNKTSFMDVCNEVMKRLVSAEKDFAFYHPVDNAGKKWQKVTQIPSDFREMFEMCFQTNGVYFEFEYMQDMIRVEIDIFEQDSMGLLFSIPERETGLDEAESEIISFILKHMDPVFCYAFCDNEAYIEQNARDTLLAPTYSITVINGETPAVHFNEWRIDGYTKR